MRRGSRPARSTRAGKSRQPPTRATRSLLASRPLLRPLRDLEPQQLDVIALAVVAIGIFLGGVAYAGWAGGTLGHAAFGAALLLIGRLAYVLPVALVLGGARMLIRDTDFALAGRPLRAGTICLTLALALAFAAGTLGLGPGGSPDHAMWAVATLEARGGVLGGLELLIAGHLLSNTGADLLAIFLMLAAGILFSGATFASVINSSRRRAAALRRHEAGSATRRAEIRAARLRRREDPLDPSHSAGATFDHDFTQELSDQALAQQPDAETTMPGFEADDAPATFEDAIGQRSFGFGEDDAEGRQSGDQDTAAGADASDRDPDGGPGESGGLADDFGGPGEFAAFVGLDARGDPQGDEPASGPGAPMSREAAASGEREPGAQITGGEREAAGAQDAASEQPAAGPRREIDPSELTPAGRYRASVMDDPEFVWALPSPRLLVRSTGDAARPDTAGQAQVAKALIEALGNFHVQAKVVGQVSGPHITRYELRLAPGIKVSKVASLKDDLAYALAATDIRILAPIPGKTAVGVEVPNARRRIVHLGDVYRQPPGDASPITVWLGKDISGRAIPADLAKMPHLLVAGTTGSGKSACINAMLSSILLRANPHQVRMVLVDPKQVELSHYESIPHLLTPVITNPRMAANALQNLVKEMEQRYGTMRLARARSLPELNKYRARHGEPPLPYILCVIDELADLMMVAPADVEDSIIRLAQKARAVGMHLVLATQSPRVDVITGMIKANVPSRIAFAVASQTDSRVILDQGGAEALLGQGDMLFSPLGSSKLQRIQGAFIDEEQIAQLTECWRRQGEPAFREELLEEAAAETPEESSSEDALDPDEDPLLEEAISLVASMGTASTSMLQRRLRLGYTRAGRLIDMLERRGIVSGYEGSKPRQVLISESDVPRILVALAGGGRHAPAEGPAHEPAREPARELTDADAADTDAG